MLGSTPTVAWCHGQKRKQLRRAFNAEATVNAHGDGPFPLCECAVSTAEIFGQAPASSYERARGTFQRGRPDMPGDVTRGDYCMRLCQCWRWRRPAPRPLLRPGELPGQGHLARLDEQGPAALLLGPTRALWIIRRQHVANVFPSRLLCRPTLCLPRPRNRVSMSQGLFYSLAPSPAAFGVQGRHRHFVACEISTGWCCPPSAVSA